MNNEMDSLDTYLRSEIEGLELTPSEGAWSAVEQKMSRNANLKKENTIRKLRISLSVVVPAFCLFVAYHYYDNAGTPAVVTTGTSKNTVASNNAGQTAVSPQMNAVNEDAKVISNNQRTHTDDKKETQALNVLPSTNPSAENKTVTTEEEPVLATRPVTSIKDKNSVKTNTPDKITVLKYVIPTESTAGAETNASEQGSVDRKEKDEETNSLATENANEKAFFVPSAFTPNGDGLNDVFLPKASEEPKEYKLSIFDRAGNLVFLTDNFKTGWDGKVTRGGAETIREDVYMWRIEMKNAKGEKEHLMGSLTLLK